MCGEFSVSSLQGEREIVRFLPAQQIFGCGGDLPP
ncbi:hypothetical protein T06_16594 [Trichinella sp. T6]|nr:hypothetical protein T06_16594 [Trichinella sp. T6]